MADAGPHGILRKSARKEKRTAGIAWDEPTIAEHDKDRGTRMKIDEPDTPFEHAAPDAGVDEALSLGAAAKPTGTEPPASTAAQWDAVDALSAEHGAAASSAAAGDEDGDDWADSDDESKPAEAGAAAAEAKRFEAARRAHYAEEVAKMKELMRRGVLDEDEDEDGDGEDA